MKKLVILMMALALIVLVSEATSAQPGPDKGYGPGFAANKGFRWQQLNLTDDQQAKIATLRLKLHQKMLPLQNQLGENRAKMRTLATAENADMKAINKLIDESSSLRAKLTKLRMANRQEIRKLLTEEQRIMFDSRSMAFYGHRNFNRPGWCPNGFGRGPGFGPPPRD